MAWRQALMAFSKHPKPSAELHTKLSAALHDSTFVKQLLTTEIRFAASWERAIEKALVAAPTLTPFALPDLQLAMHRLGCNWSAAAMALQRIGQLHPVAVTSDAVESQLVMERRNGPLSDRREADVGRVLRWLQFADDCFARCDRVPSCFSPRLRVVAFRSVCESRGDTWVEALQWMSQRCKCETCAQPMPQELGHLLHRFTRLRRWHDGLALVSRFSHLLTIRSGEQATTDPDSEVIAKARSFLVDQCLENVSSMPYSLRPCSQTLSSPLSQWILQVFQNNVAASAQSLSERDARLAKVVACCRWELSLSLLGQHSRLVGLPSIRSFSCAIDADLQWASALHIVAAMRSDAGARRSNAWDVYADEEQYYGVFRDDRSSAAPGQLAKSHVDQLLLRLVKTCVRSTDGVKPDIAIMQPLLDTIGCRPEVALRAARRL